MPGLSAAATSTSACLHCRLAGTDELFRREPARWQQLVESAKPVLDHLLTALDGIYSNYPAAKSRAAEILLPGDSARLPTTSSRPRAFSGSPARSASTRRRSSP